MAIALVLGGGAPNLTLMAGAVAALDDAGVKFDVVSTSGAGMLIGLLYAAPKGMSRSEALKNCVNMGVHDAIYNLFPVNYKVFHKPGQAAQAYTRFWQTAARNRDELGKLSRQWMESALGGLLPGAAFAPYRAMCQQFWSAMPAAAKPSEDAQRFFDDWAAFMLATFCPSDLGMASLGMCQPAPFVEEAVDFGKVKDFAGEFYLSAYCIEDQEMVLFHKDDINIQHFQAALAFPLIYAPFKLNGKTYLEGAAKDTLNFKGLFEYRKDETHPPIDTIVVCDVLGIEKLIGEPRNLYDAWVKSIIVPLTAVAEDDLKLFEQVHMRKLDPTPELLRVNFEGHVPDGHWPNVLDWSHSNLKTLYDVGYKAGKALCAEHGHLVSGGRKARAATAAAPAKVIPVKEGNGSGPGKPRAGARKAAKRRGRLEAS